MRVVVAVSAQWIVTEAEKSVKRVDQVIYIACLYERFQKSLFM